MFQTFAITEIILIILILGLIVLVGIGLYFLLRRK